MPHAAYVGRIGFTRLAIARINAVEWHFMPGLARITRDGYRSICNDKKMAMLIHADFDAARTKTTA